MDPIAQPDFDRLALYVAVAWELRMEPFLSPDNHDTLTQGGSGVSAQFSHPAFLKSALLPFRKLWAGSSDLCAFEKVRDLVFRIHPSQELLSQHQTRFFDDYDKLLEQPAHGDWSSESTQKIVDMWIYTQGVHSGQRENKQGKIIRKDEPTPREFQEWSERIGREKFEFLFRISVQIVAKTYLAFLHLLVEPLFHTLRDNGMSPGFEAATALTYSPYPHPRYKVTFDDVFWHLDRESFEETFDRVLQRQSYSELKSFLRAFFGHKASAAAAVCESQSFADMLIASRAVVVPPGEPVAEQGRYFGGNFDVYAGGKVTWRGEAEGILARLYADFRRTLFEERRRTRRIADQPWS